jgi:hypothetical protein
VVCEGFRRVGDETDGGKEVTDQDGFKNVQLVLSIKTVIIEYRVCWK